MLSLPHGRIFLAIGWLLIGLIIYGSLASSVPSPGVQVNDKVQHFTCYFLLTLWFSGLYPRQQHWILGLCFVLLGAILEVLQGAFTQVRMMDVRDLAANTAGIAAAFVLAGFGIANWARRVEAWWTRP